MFGAACFQQQASEAVANQTNVLTSAVVDSFGPSGPESASVIESRRDVGWSVPSGTEPTIAFTCVSHVSLRPSDVKFFSIFILALLASGPDLVSLVIQ